MGFGTRVLKYWVLGLPTSELHSRSLPDPDPKTTGQAQFQECEARLEEAIAVTSHRDGI